MYQLYLCDGVVLGKRADGEASTTLFILTEQLGLVQATAKSSRAEESKLRYGLQVLLRGQFSFIRGKRTWRLVGVEGISHEMLSSSIENRRAAGRIAKLFLRLVQGEDPVPGLYPEFLRGLSALARATSLEAIESIECVLVLRTLSYLGYLPEAPELRPFIEGEFATAELAHMVERSRAFLFRTINQSLEATGL